MNVIFVTGSDAAFFNSMLVGLQSFAERMPGQRLLVCDFGFSGAQAAFLRGLGVLLERPPTLASAGVFHCKAALLAYLRHNGHDIGPDDIVVWLDADLTLMDVGVGDFAAVLAAMASAGVAIAVCPEPLGRSFGQMLSGPNASTMAPSARIAAQAGMDFASPYVSSGLFFCRSAAFLTRWQELTQGNAYHPLFEQNMFNVALHEKRAAFVALDCEEWQAQGPSLDKIALVPTAKGGRLAAAIGDKNIKTLHATSHVRRPRPFADRQLPHDGARHGSGRTVQAVPGRGAAPASVAALGSLPGRSRQGAPPARRLQPRGAAGRRF
jgi:hypothetical protein